MVTAAESHSHLAAVRVWLPQGEWFDIFSGHRYLGGRVLTMHRDLETLPVLARAGTVLPLQADPFAAVGTNPHDLVLRVFPGSGSTELVEDDGAGAPGANDRQITAITVETSERADGLTDVRLVIAAPSGPGALTQRGLGIDLVGVMSAEHISASLGDSELTLEGAAAATDEASRTLAPALRIELGTVDLTGGLVLNAYGVRRREMDLAASAFALLDRAEIAYQAKESAWQAMREGSGLALVQELNAVELPGMLRDALVELAAVHEGN